MAGRAKADQCFQFAAWFLAASNEASLTGKKRRCWPSDSARALLSSGFLSPHPVKLHPGSSSLTGGRGGCRLCWCQGQTICSGADQRRASKGLLQKHRHELFPDQVTPPASGLTPLSSGAQCKHPERLVERSLAFRARTNSPSLSSTTLLSTSWRPDILLDFENTRKQKAVSAGWVYCLPGESACAHKGRNKTGREAHYSLQDPFKEFNVL